MEIELFECVSRGGAVGKKNSLEHRGENSFLLLALCRFGGFSLYHRDKTQNIIFMENCYGVVIKIRKQRNRKNSD